MLVTEETFRLVDPAGALAEVRACRPGRPTALTVATSRFAPEPSASFWPAVKPVVLVTGTLVEPAGTVIGPSGSGCQSVVEPVAAVPMALILCASPSMLTVSPTVMPVIERTLIVLSPALAGAERPELERP